jgi:hypothetical protein
MHKKKAIVLCLVTLAVTSCGAVLYAAMQQGLGYSNTPIIPGTNWHVHDGERPQPRIVASGATFSHNAPAPADAVVLFDGKDLSKWQSSNGQAAAWRLDEAGFMETGRGSVRTRDRFADFQLHLEFATPSQVRGEGQGRGNSGIIFNGMYEIQVLDSYDNKTYPDGQCGAMYGQTPPLVNACKAPGEWQTYDIIFESPRWDADGELVKKANVTVIQNGLVLHHKREFIGCTDGIGGVRHTALGAYRRQHPPEVFIELQNHGNPLRYRNIWVRPLGEYDKPLPSEGPSPSPESNAPTAESESN